jgi:hypothetical protein
MFEIEMIVKQLFAQPKAPQRSDQKGRRNSTLLLFMVTLLINLQYAGLYK